MPRYCLPTIPYTPVDLVNRCAAATGSARYARVTSDANYNGHLISVSFKKHAMAGPIWNCEYWWAGRVVLARGTLQTCLNAASQEYARGARGTEVSIHLDNDAPETMETQLEAVKAIGAVEAPPTDSKPSFWTNKHEAAMDAMGYEKYFPGMVSHAIDWDGQGEWKVVRDAWLKGQREPRTVKEPNLEDI